VIRQFRRMFWARRIVFRRKIPPTWTGFRGRSLWDWMQLIGTLSGLAVIAVAVFTVNNQLNNQERMAAERSASALQLEEQRVASEAENFAEDRRRETERFHEQAFRSYLETMTRLLLDNGLSEAASEDPVTQIARAQTIDVLRQLDADRNGLLIQFLKNSRLIRSTGLTV